MTLNVYQGYSSGASQFVRIRKEDLHNLISGSFSTGYIVGSSVAYLRGIEQSCAIHKEDREVTTDEIKKRIANYFHQNAGKNIDYVDLVEKFGFSLRTIVAVCEELEREGEIVAVD